MSENDFYVAIQGVMTAAREAGWEINVVGYRAADAAEEWIEEMTKDLPDTEDLDA